MADLEEAFKAERWAELKPSTRNACSAVLRVLRDTLGASKPVAEICPEDAKRVFKTDKVILDNLSSHKSEPASAILKQRGAWFLYLPPYSPDLNPIAMAFAKLKAHLRTAKARTVEALWQAVGSICELYSPDQSGNYLKHAGYVAD